MIREPTLQLRIQTGPQAQELLPRNGGGVIGVDEAGCAVTLLEAQRT